MSDILLSLLVTAIGMGLVFLSILLLWGMMAALLRLAPEREQPEEPAEATTLPAEANIPRANNARLAAAVAVAVALGKQADTAPHEFPLPQTAMVSAWQAVMRSEMLRKRGPR